MKQNPLKTQISIRKGIEANHEKLELRETWDEELRVFDIHRGNSDFAEENFGVSFLLIKGE